VYKPEDSRFVKPGKARRTHIFLRQMQLQIASSKQSSRLRGIIESGKDVPSLAPRGANPNGRVVLRNSRRGIELPNWVNSRRSNVFDRHSPMNCTPALAAIGSRFARKVALSVLRED
jgi:hypothetical protein